MPLHETHAVHPIPSKEGKALIRENHYTKSCHNGPMCFGLHEQGRLIGVIAFATPISENVRAKPFGVEHKDRVTELHRMWLEDGHNKNAATFFIKRAFALLLEKRPAIRCVISFADTTEGHTGGVYLAANAIAAGSTGSKARFFLDSDGALRAPRQCGVNISLDDASSRGWRPVMREPKRRFLWVVAPNRREKRKWEAALRWEGGYFSQKPA